MAYLYLIVLIILIFRFRRNFEATLIAYAPFKLVFHRGIELVDIPGIPVINLDLVITIVAFFFFSKRKFLYSNQSIPNFIKIGCVIYCIGCFVYGSFHRFVPQIFFYEPITVFLYFYMLMKVIGSGEQLRNLIKGFIIVGAVLCIDAFVDVLTGHNIIIEIEQLQAGPHFWLSENDVFRAGMTRTTSFMGHSIAMGTIASLIWGILMISYFKTVQYINVNKLFIFVVCALPMCMLLANSRTTIFTVLCFTPLFLNSKAIFSKSGIFLFVAIILTISLNYEYVEWLYNSVFHEDKTAIGGSTTDLRERQFDIAMYYFLQNPILGTGIDFDVLAYEDEKDVMGMESVWLQLFMYQGLVGVVAYVWLLLTGLISFFKYNIHYIWFSLAWVVSITFSSQVSVSMFLYVIAIIISYKTYCFKKFEL